MTCVSLVVGGALVAVSGACLLASIHLTERGHHRRAMTFLAVACTSGAIGAAVIVALFA